MLTSYFFKDALIPKHMYIVTLAFKNTFYGITVKNILNRWFDKGYYINGLIR